MPGGDPPDDLLERNVEALGSRPAVDDDGEDGYLYSGSAASRRH